MPIPKPTRPTRDEPATSTKHRKSASVGQITSTRPTSLRKPSTQPPSHTSVEPSQIPKNQIARPTNPPSSKTTTTSSLLAPGFSRASGIPPPKSSFLPQRHASVTKRREVSITENERVTSSESGESRPGTSSNKAAAVIRPKLEEGLENLDGVDPTKSEIGSQRQDEEQTPTPASPSKTQATTVALTGPPSPTRSQMLPPPRPAPAVSDHPKSVARTANGSEIKGHSRVQSQGLGSTPSILPPSRKSHERSASTSSSNLATTRAKKPQFSTYQQHFSPKKTSSKPPSATSITSKVTEADHLSSSNSDTLALQTELLQLSLLHSTVSRKEAERRVASEKQLREKFNNVVDVYRKLREEEGEAQCQRNLRALNQWYADANENVRGYGFQKQVQTLSRIIQEVTDLSDSYNGRYSRVIHRFTTWLDEVERIRQTRGENQNDTPSPDDDPLTFIEPLEEEWKEESTLLTTKVDLCLEELRSLDVPTTHEEDTDLNDSSLRRLVQDHQDLLQQMKEELHIMRAIEAGILKEEQSWVSQTADLALQNHTRHEPSTPRVPVWIRS